MMMMMMMVHDDDDDDDDESNGVDDLDNEVERQNKLRKQAGLPELPLDALPSASAQKMMKLSKIAYDPFF